MIPWSAAHQAPLSTGFSRQEVWSGLPFPSPGALPDPEIEPRSQFALQADSSLSPQGSPRRSSGGTSPCFPLPDKGIRRLFPLSFSSVTLSLYFCLAFGYREPRFLETRTVGLWTSLTLEDSETVYLRLGLELMCWDSNPAQTHGTWFQELMKLRFFMSHHKKNSVRDTVIGKKWIYSDSERSTLHKQSVGHHRG